MGLQCLFEGGESAVQQGLLDDCVIHVMFVLGRNGTTITHAAKLECWEEIATLMKGTGPVERTSTAIKNKKEKWFSLVKQKVNGTDNRFFVYFY